MFTYTKQTLFILLLALTAILPALTTGAQTTAQMESQDSTVDIVAYFCKNDTMEYRYEHHEVKIEDNDTVIESKYISDLRLIVRDSTSEGYEIECIPLGMQSYDSDSLMNSIVLSAYEKLGDIHTILAIDELGNIKNIKNWDEIKKYSRTAIKYICDSLYAAIPQLEEAMPRTRIESLLSLRFINEKQYLENDDELQLLFSLFGNRVNIGKTETDSKTDAGYPQHIELVAGYGPSSEEYGFTNDYFIQSATDFTIPKEDVKEYTLGALGLLLSDKVKGVMDEELQNDSIFTDAKISIGENYVYFFNGWPYEMEYYKSSDLMNRKKIDYKTIYCTSRCWTIPQYVYDDESGVDM